MTFFESIKTCFRKYANFKGRATRSEFWWFQLFMIVFTYGAMALDNLLFGFTLEDVVTPLALIAILIITIPNAAVTARRLHDIGWSGWVQLPVFLSFVAYLDVIIPDFSLSTVGAGIIFSSLVFWVVMAIFLIRGGKAEANKYGPNPKSPDMGQVFN